jgi:acetolactate synthase-1/2/3 large subunit
MKINGAEIIIRMLESYGITTVTGIPGGAILPLYDALGKSSIRHVLARHEQGAAFIAQGMARSSGKATVCFATSGPGATNLLTAIADAKMDSVPLVAITGQVPTAYLGSDAFQEVDIYHMSVPVTKHNFQVRSARELFDVMPDAFEIATEGRPGPVLVDVPKDVQIEIVDSDVVPMISRMPKSAPEIDSVKIRMIAAIIDHAERPVIYAGGGVNNERTAEFLSALAHRSDVPVALSLMGLGVFPKDDPLSLGMIGMHGNPVANRAISESDLVIALGVRFDDRAVGRLDLFAPRASVIHVDIDDTEIDKIKKSNYALRGDACRFIERIAGVVVSQERKQWRARIVELGRDVEYPVFGASSSHPANVIRMIGDMIPDGCPVATDVGQHQMWCAQILRHNRPRSFFTSGGLGTMGFGLPVAIGIALAHSSGPVVCITGDGSIMMNIQELATLADLNLPVKIFVINNGHLGLVRQQQELFYGKRYVACRFNSGVDFARIAEAFGIRGIRVDDFESDAQRIGEIMADDCPALFDMRVDSVENVMPMVPPGSANTEMLMGAYSRLG